jgi:FKBP-type peptidyl-prolyl cis-trans isomerase
MKLLIPISFILLVVLASCKKDEETQEPIRDVTEQAAADKDALLEFLQSHTYNYEDFEVDNPAATIAIEIDTLTDANSDKTPLIDWVQERQINVYTNDGNVIPHTLYYLVARQGVGAQPAVVDSTYVAYEGSLLNGTVFDQRQSPIWFDLLQSIRGFREGVTAFKSGTYTVNEDNTVNFKNYGQGVIFIPSGMGYFSSTQAKIPAYSPLVFKISLFITKESDHDQDGILTKNEFDNNNDGTPDDTDEDGIPDYLDQD